MTTKKSQAESRPTIDPIREHGNDIESAVSDIEIFLKSIINSVDGFNSDPFETVNTIDCYTRAALDKVAQVRALRDNLMHSVALLRGAQ